MLKFAHIILIPFTGVGLNGGFRGDEWFAHRIKIFKEYTAKSLLNQSNRQFLLWLTFRPQEEGHPYLKGLGTWLGEQKLPTLMTFEGLPYHDDKFSRGIKNKLWNFARSIRQSYRERKPVFIQAFFELFTDKNKTLPQRLEKSLFKIQSIQPFRDTSYIFLSRIDSDDMFHKDYAKKVQEFYPFEGAIVCKNGYIYNAQTKELAEWNPETNPPFHTIIMRSSTFFNPIAHIQFYNGYKSHEDIPKVAKVLKVLEGNNYCVTVHGKHISTTFNHPFKGKSIIENKSSVLTDFGV